MKYNSKTTVNLLKETCNISFDFCFGDDLRLLQRITFEKHFHLLGTAKKKISINSKTWMA